MTSELRFTPGPWEIRHRLNSVGDQLRGGRYVILQTGSSLREDFYICEMPFAAVRGQDEKEHEANAHLIAAAPDLYAAVLALMAYAKDYCFFVGDGMSPRGHEIAAARIAEARAALSRAEGVPSPGDEKKEG